MKQIFENLCNLIEYTFQYTESNVNSLQIRLLTVLKSLRLKTSSSPILKFDLYMAIVACRLRKPEFAEPFLSQISAIKSREPVEPYMYLVYEAFRLILQQDQETVIKSVRPVENMVRLFSDDLELSLIKAQAYSIAQIVGKNISQAFVQTINAAQETQQYEIGTRARLLFAEYKKRCDEQLNANSGDDITTMFKILGFPTDFIQQQAPETRVDNVFARKTFVPTIFGNYIKDLNVVVKCD